MKNHLINIIVIFTLLIGLHIILLFLPVNYYETYFNIIRPIIYIIITAFAYISLGKTLKIYSGKKTLIMVAILGVIIYLSFNFVVGIIASFGQNSMNLTFLGIIRNFWAYIVLLILRENLRSLIMTHIGEKKRNIFIIITTIIFTFISLDSLQGIIKFDLYQQLDWFFVNFLPILTINLWFTYAAYNGGLIGNLIFAIGYNFLIYFSPILPNIPFIVDAIALYCIVFIMFIIYDSVEWMAKREAGINIAYKEKRNWLWTIIPLVVLIIMLLFGLGFFNIRPMAVASNSMKPEFKRGDVIYIKKVSPDKITVGQVIQYIRGDISIVHRVYEIREDTEKGKYFIFKGDSNNTVDAYPVYSDQIVGIVIAKTPLLGYPSLLFQK